MCCICTHFTDYNCNSPRGALLALEFRTILDHVCLGLAGDDAVHCTGLTLQDQAAALGFPYLVEMHPNADKREPWSPLVAIIGSMVVFIFVVCTALGVPQCTSLFDAVCLSYEGQVFTLLIDGSADKVIVRNDVCCKLMACRRLLPDP